MIIAGQLTDTGLSCLNGHISLQRTTTAQEITMTNITKTLSWIKKATLSTALIGSLVTYSVNAHHVEEGAASNHHGIASSHTALLKSESTSNAQDFINFEETLNRDYLGEIPEGSSQYDFFIGEWDITVKEYNKEGELVDTAEGLWYAKYLHGGRVVFDDVVIFGEEGKMYPGFPSLRTYAPKIDKWISMHMAPLSDNASCRNLGTWANNEMNIDATCKRPDGTVSAYSKVRFYNITEDSIDYTWHDSKDGENWWLYVTFEFKRRK